MIVTPPAAAVTGIEMDEVEIDVALVDDDDDELDRDAEAEEDMPSVMQRRRI